MLDIREAKTAAKALFLQAASMSGFEVTSQSPERFSDLVEKGFKRADSESRRPEAVASILKLIAATLENAKASFYTTLTESSVDEGKKRICPVYPFD
jgi:hypothetical protein